MTTIQTRDHEVTVHAADQGLRFTVSLAGGVLLAHQLTEGEFDVSRQADLPPAEALPEGLHAIVCIQGDRSTATSGRALVYGSRTSGSGWR